MSNDRGNEPFLSRWSRQKQQQTKQPEAKPKTPAGAKPEQPEPEIDLSKLTKVEDLTAESDITQFLQKGVPEALQKLALRKMWSLDPAIRDFVEVAENQWDFNMPGGIHGLYQDLTEGTDVSVWMAQATQSVFGDDAKKPAETVADRPHGGAIEACRDAELAANNAALQHGMPSLSPAAVSASAPAAPALAIEQLLPTDQVTGVVQKLGTSQEPVDAAPLPSRRRHGGALPT